MEFADKFTIAELIHAWGVYRDQGKWKELRGTFTPDGHISVSWFRGPFEQFVERCRSGFAASRTWSRHHLFTPTIKLAKDRAIAETPVIIRVRQKFGMVFQYAALLDSRRAPRRRLAHCRARRDLRARPARSGRTVAGIRCAVRGRRHRTLSRAIPLHGFSACACRGPLARGCRLSRRRAGNGRSLRALFKMAQWRRSLSGRPAFLRGSPWQSIPMSRRRI